MGQKVNPIISRVSSGFGSWKSSWFAPSSEVYANNCIEDVKVFSYLEKASPYICDIKLHRKPHVVIVEVFVSNTSVFLSKNKDILIKMSSDLSKMLHKKVSINLCDYKRPFLSARFVSSHICSQVESRKSYKRVVNQAISSVLREGALGVKIIASGRLNGAEIARSEVFKMGRMPISTFSADISFSCRQAVTKYGVVGFKVWIYRRAF